MLLARVIIFLLGLVLFFAPPFHSVATGEEVAQGSEEKTERYEITCKFERAAIDSAFARASLYLQGLTAVSARFVQHDALGVRHEGDFLLYPPYRMRLDYDAPSGLRLYVNAREALHVDMQRRFVRQYPLVALPAVRMLQRIFAGKGTKGLQAVRVCTLGEHFEYIRFRKKPGKQNSGKQNSGKQKPSNYAELYFRLIPNYSFVGWDVHTSKAGTTRIRLGALELVPSPKITTFRFEPPWKKERSEK